MRIFIDIFIIGRQKKPDLILHERERLVTKRDIALENSARGSIRGMFRLLEVSNGERSNICQTGRCSIAHNAIPFRPARACIYIF